MDEEANMDEFTRLKKMSARQVSARCHKYFQLGTTFAATTPAHQCCDPSLFSSILLHISLIQG
jgi:hypothetical protein